MKERKKSEMMYQDFCLNPLLLLFCLINSEYIIVHAISVESLMMLTLIT